MPENKNQMHGMTISTTQWRHGWQRVPEQHRRGSNENTQSNDLADRVQNMGNLVKRTEVLAQILSPSGKVHVHTDVSDHIHCFPQSVCWRFPEKVE